MALADLGDATLVSSNAITENRNEISSNKVIETAKTTNDYFNNTRLEREKMYSQMIESYQKMLDSATVSEVQKGIAQTEINNINHTKNAIMIIENLLKLKEIEDVVVLMNDKSINVVVKPKEQLKPEIVAQIQNIVTREMNTEIENIHISEQKQVY